MKQCVASNASPNACCPAPEVPGAAIGNRLRPTTRTLSGSLIVIAVSARGTVSRALFSPRTTRTKVSARCARRRRAYFECGGVETWRASWMPRRAIIGRSAWWRACE